MASTMRGVHARLDRLLAHVLEAALLRDLLHGVRVLRRPAHVQDLVVVERLARHRLFGELRVEFRHICHEGDAAVLQHAYCEKNPISN